MIKGLTEMTAVQSVTNRRELNRLKIINTAAHYSTRLFVLKNTITFLSEQIIYELFDCAHKLFNGTHLNYSTVNMKIIQHYANNNFTIMILQQIIVVTITGLKSLKRM